MADDNLNDHDTVVNAMCKNSVASSRFLEEADEHLAILRALVDVVLSQGLENCSDKTVHYYFAAFDLLLEIAAKRLAAMQKTLSV